MIPLKRNSIDRYINSLAYLVFIVLLGLILLFIFRWDEGPTQKDKKMTIIHKTDRWTHQNWIVLYGNSDGVWYSGDERPISSEKQFELVKSNLMDKEKNSIAFEKLQLEKEKLEKEISNNQIAFDSFNKAYDEIEINTNDIPSMEWKHSGHQSVKENFRMI